MAQLDTRIPLMVPNTLAQGSQIAQTNQLNAQSFGQGFNAVQKGMEAPYRRNALALDVKSAELQQTMMEQQFLGGVLQNLDALPEGADVQSAWGQARQTLIGRGIFEAGELPEVMTPDLANELSILALTPAKELTTGMQEYNFARSQGYPGSFADWKKLNSAGTNINVNTAPSFPEYNKLPPGFVYARNPDNTIKTNESGAPVVVPIKGTEAARDVANANASTQTAIGKANDTISVIDSFTAHPGFDRLYGAFDTRFGRIPIPDQFIPNMPGGEAANAEPFLNQIEGQAFLQAFESLKGGGQITEVEGRKATEAISRATNRGQSPEAARAALDELRGIAIRAMGNELRKQGVEFDEIQVLGGRLFIQKNGEWFEKQ